MKRWLIPVFAAAVLAQAALAMNRGEAVYQELRCGSCHAKAGEFKKTPSLEQIAKAYTGQADSLISYFKGEAEPIVIPERGSSMKRQIKKTAELSDTDRRELADYVMSFR